MSDSNDFAGLSEPFKALISNKVLFYQLLDLHPSPLQVFVPDGTCIFINRAYKEMTGDLTGNVVGTYNLKNDPLCLEILGQEVMDRIFRGETCSFSDFPAPIQDVVDKGYIDYKPWEAATMDIFNLPLWDGDSFVCTISFFTIKGIYIGRADIIKAQEFIKEHWQDEYDIGEIAGAATLSKRHFQRVFKEVTESTPFDYYQNVKIEKIKEKLLNGNLSIEQAFEACGVDYRGAYLSLFKEKTGLSPSDYRKKNNIK
jgi:AraC-like DNA-binding protein